MPLQQLHHFVVVRRLTPLPVVSWTTSGAETRRIYRAMDGGGVACSAPLILLHFRGVHIHPYCEVARCNVR